MPELSSPPLPSPLVFMRLIKFFLSLLSPMQMQTGRMRLNAAYPPAIVFYAMHPIVH